MNPSWIVLIACTLLPSAENIKVNVSKQTAVNEKKYYDISTTPSPIFVTPRSEPVTRTTTTKRPKKIKSPQAAESRKSVASHRLESVPTKFTFPLIEKNNDLQRQPSLNYQRHRGPEAAQQRQENPLSSVPATYESIVYDPGTKEATSAFMRSEMWETPELVVQDTKKRHEGKNSLITTSSRIEYSPNMAPAQTPLSQIQFRQPPPRRPHPTVLPQKRNDDIEEESESQQTEIEEDEDDNEELNEAEEEEEETEKPRYPVNLQETPFNPFENVQEPDDIYSDVLSNIGSVFEDDEGTHNGLANQRAEFPIRSESPNHINNLLPQFEQYSYENLRKNEDGGEDGDYVEENEELTENEDEGDETRQVQLQKPTQTTQRPYKENKPARENRLKESPFPSVKIVGEKISEPKKEKTSQLAFNPWLPTQPSTHSTWSSWPSASQTVSESAKPKKKDRQHWSMSTIPPTLAALRENPSSVAPYSWKDIIEKRREPVVQNQPNDDDDDSRPHFTSHETSQTENSGPETEDSSGNKPYHASYKTSYNKSWKSSSPKKNEKSSYNQSWKNNKPVGENKESESQQKPVTKEMKVKKSKKRSSEILAPRPVKEEVLDHRESQQIFVTPVPTTVEKATTESGFTEKTTEMAVDVIDDLYNEQHQSI